MVNNYLRQSYMWAEGDRLRGAFFLHTRFASPWLLRFIGYVKHNLVDSRGLNVYMTAPQGALSQDEGTTYIKQCHWDGDVLVDIRGERPRWANVIGMEK